MILYLVVFLLLIALALAEVLLRNKKISFITSSLMALMAGLRFYTGYDFLSYKDFFQQTDKFSDIFNGTVDAESGYLFLNYLFSSIGLNFYFFILFFSIVSIGLLGYFLYRYTPYPSLFLMYYYARFFLVRDMGQIRSALACIILLYAIPFIIKKKFIPFLLIVLLASLFHVTALFFVAAYILNSLLEKLTIKNVFSLLMISMTIGILIQIPQLYAWAIPGRYLAYFTSPDYTDGKWLLNPILWMQLALFFGSFLFIHPTSEEEKSKFNVYLKTYLISSLVLVTAGTLGTVGGRISTLFATSEILLVPYLFTNFTKNKFINIILFIVFTICIFILIFIISGAYNQYVPYQTIFNF